MKLASKLHQARLTNLVSFYGFVDLSSFKLIETQPVDWINKQMNTDMLASHIFTLQEKHSGKCRLLFNPYYIIFHSLLQLFIM